jgi:hypothetical protein
VALPAVSGLTVAVIGVSCLVISPNGQSALLFDFLDTNTYTYQ